MLVEAIKLAFIFFQHRIGHYKFIVFQFISFFWFHNDDSIFSNYTEHKMWKTIVTNGEDIVLIFLFRVKSVLTHCKRYDAEQNNIILCWGFSFFREKKLWFGHVAPNYRWLIISIDGLRTLTEFNWTNRT